MSKTPPAPPSAALDALLDLQGANFQPQRLDEIHEYLKLLGVVLGQIALLDVATASLTGKGDAAAKVAAARALMSLKEKPEAIVERLRRSPFTDLRFQDLESIVQQLKEGGVSLQDALTHIRKEHADG